MTKRKNQPVKQVEETQVVETQQEIQVEVVETPTEVVVEVVKTIKEKGIGKFIINEILTTEKSNKEILEEVLKTFQGSVTTMACIAWYKSKLRREGLIAQRVLKKSQPVVEVQPA